MRNRLRWGMGMMVLGMGVGVRLQGQVATQGTGTMAAGTAASQSVRVEKADVILDHFPMNAVLRVGRNETITVEGRVLEVRDNAPAKAGGTLPATGGTTAGKTGVHVILVGTRQRDADLAHLTCAMEPGSEAAARALKPGAMVRLTGTGAGVTTEAERVDLVNCRDLSVEAAMPVYTSMLLGRWSGNLQMNGAAFAPWRNWAKFREAAGVIAFDLRLASEGAVTLQVSDMRGPLTRQTGMWRLIQDSDKGPQLFLSLKDLDPVYVPLNFDGETLKLGGPAAEAAAFALTMTCTQAIGKPLPVDPDATGEQMAAWLKANISLQDPSKLVDDTMSKLLEALLTEGSFTALYGPGLIKSKKMMQVCVVQGKLVSFELSDAQRVRSGVADNTMRTDLIKGRTVAMVPEVKVESLVLDSKNVLDTSRELTGKVTLRALRRAPNAKYALLLENAHGMMVYYFDRAPGADAETVEFKFAKPGGAGGGAGVYGQPNPLPVVISVCRLAEGEMLSVSAAEVRLMDIGP